MEKLFVFAFLFLMCVSTEETINWMKQIRFIWMQTALL